MKRSACTSLSLLLCVMGGIDAAAADSALATYTAVYEVIRKDRGVGSAEFSVTFDEARDQYTFHSSAQAKGMLKLVSPNPVVERSSFVVLDGAIRPLEFWYEDGSRKGEDNLHAVFDWDAGKVVITGEQHVELDLRPGVLDRGTMQVALMRDLAAADAPGPYLLADGDALKVYEYALEGDDRLSTPLGELATLRYRQTRPGSSRSAQVWVAPELRYLPVKVQQYRDGEPNTAFVLQSVQGLDTTR